MDNLIIGGDIADDKWYSKWLQITPTALTAKGSYVIDLVDIGYLPQNDNYDYEILFSCWLWTATAAAGNSANLTVHNGSDSTARPYITLLYAITRVAGYSSIQGCSCTLPLLNGNKKICFCNGHNFAYSSWGIQFTGYRRLGTNV